MENLIKCFKYNSAGFIIDGLIDRNIIIKVNEQYGKYCKVTLSTKCVNKYLWVGFISCIISSIFFMLVSLIANGNVVAMASTYVFGSISGLLLFLMIPYGNIYDSCYVLVEDLEE